LFEHCEAVGAGATIEVLQARISLTNPMVKANAYWGVASPLERGGGRRRVEKNLLSVAH
jgi:hypothetical protein